MKLQNKIFILVSACMLFVTTVVFISFYIYFRNSSELIFTSLFEKTAYQASNNIENFLTEKINNISIVAQQSFVSPSNFKEKELSKIILSIRNQFDNIETLEVLDTNFKTIAHTNRIGIGALSSNQNIAVKSRESLSEKADFIISSEFYNSYFRICAPIFLDKKLKGYLIALISLARISDYFSSFESDFAGIVHPRVYIIRKDGSLIYKNTDKDFTEIFNLAISKIDGQDEVSFRDNGEFIFASKSSNHNPAELDNWSILINFSYNDLSNPLYNFRNFLVIVTLFAILLFFIIIRKVTADILSPLATINNNFKELANENFIEINENKSSALEFNELINGYNCMSRRLRLSFAELRQKSKLEALGQMAIGIGHEINNPLAVVKAHIDKLFIILGPKPNQEILNSVSAINITIDRIIAIMKSLRYFSRDASKEPFVLIELAKIIEMTLDLCAEKIKQYNIDLQILTPKGSLPIECRPIQIMQVLLNLLNNGFDAVIATPAKWIRLEVLVVKGFIQFRVTNGGHKVPPEIIQKLFVPFFTTKEYLKDAGMGMGLSISKGIAEGHKGRIFLDTEQSFTCFVLEIPQIQDVKSSSLQLPSQK